MRGFFEREDVMTSLPGLSLLSPLGMTPGCIEVECRQAPDLRNLDRFPDRDLASSSRFTAPARRQRAILSGRRALEKTNPSRSLRSSCCFGRRRLTPETFGQESQRTADRCAHLRSLTFAQEGVGEDGDGTPVVQVSQLPGGRGSHRRITVAQSAQ